MIIDCHTHFSSLESYDAMMADQRRTGSDQFTILVFERLGTDGPDSFKLAHALWFKHKHPEMVYVFGSLDLGGISSTSIRPEIDLVSQLDTLIACGCDGLKFWIGKPDRRKGLGQPLNSPVFDALFRRLEETRFPVLWHVADPPEFWDPKTVPLWARKNRWWYDETYPSKRQIDAEIADVLKRYPRMNLILPHFFFMSQDLDAAAELLKNSPAVSLDLTPGVEMFHNFTAQHKRTREFFIEHADRILFGTDIGVGISKHETGPQRGWMVRHFLESTDVFPVPDDPFMTPDERPDLHGIGLPADVMKKIYCDNYVRVLGHNRPLPLKLDAVGALLRGLENRSLKRGEGPSTAARVLKELGL
jgi:predicted TIM-barrel fold metal-dependent hydrolase